MLAGTAAVVLHKGLFLFSAYSQLLDESQVTLSFQEWLTSVTERIHQAMHYQFDGKCAPEVVPPFVALDFGPSTQRCWVPFSESFVPPDVECRKDGGPLIGKEPLSEPKCPPWEKEP